MDTWRVAISVVPDMDYWLMRFALVQFVWSFRRRVCELHGRLTRLQR